MTLLSGFSGEHPVRQTEASAVAPYPVAGDLCLNGVWRSDSPQSIRIIDQAYDFEKAELTSRLAFTAGERRYQIIPAVVRAGPRRLPT